MLEFGVFLERRGEKRYAVVRAETRHLAAAAAEAGNPGWTLVAVTVRWPVAGRCAYCGAVVFADERPVGRGNGVRCFDCG